jgi:uncharacterized protein YkwD
MYVRGQLRVMVKVVHLVVLLFVVMSGLGFGMYQLTQSGGPLPSSPGPGESAPQAQQPRTATAHTAATTTSTTVGTATRTPPSTASTSTATATRADPQTQTRTQVRTTTVLAGLDTEQVARLVAKYTNRERRNVGLHPFEYDEDLEAIAQYHSDDMVSNQYFEHVSPDGETVDARFDRFDYECPRDMPGSPFGTGGELIEQTQYRDQIRLNGDLLTLDTPDKLAKAVVEMWMNDDDERDRLTSETWEKHGVGVSVRMQNGEPAVYVTQTLC